MDQCDSRVDGFAVSVAPEPLDPVFALGMVSWLEEDVVATAASPLSRRVEQADIPREEAAVRVGGSGVDQQSASLDTEIRGREFGEVKVGDREARVPSWAVARFEDSKPEAL